MAGRKKKFYTKPPKTMDSSFERLFNQSVRKLKANQRDIENAIKQVLSNEEIKVTEAEYNELKRLTDTIEEMDKILYKKLED